MMALAQYAGWGYRDAAPAAGTYVYMDAASPRTVSSLPVANATTCTDSTSGPGILSITYTPPQSTVARTSRIVSLPDAPLAGSQPNSLAPGAPMFIYQQITYKFAVSTAYPSRRGLFRVLKTANAAAPVIDEIVAPFDSTARFRFYVVGANAAQSDVPPLNTVRGIELVLAGSSPRKPQDRDLAHQALVTGVFFMNRTNTNVNQ
jgi:hypothetical protein